MTYMKSTFLIVLSMLFVPAVYAWGPSFWDNPGYDGSYAGRTVRPLDVRKGIQIEKDMDEQGYVLRIHLTGISPEAIETKVVRGGLLLRSSQSSMSRRSGDYGERSFSHFFNISRRIRLPYDADISRMVRSDGIDMIEISLPRRQWN